MTLNQLIDEVAARASIDRLSQDNITLLMRWINITQNDIARRYTWPFLARRTTVTSVVDRVGSSTVTVDATNGSQTITGTSTTIPATDVGRFIQFASSNDWYEITARASNTSFTVTPAYAPATETTMNFTIRTFFYNLPSDCYKVYSVRQARTPTKIHHVQTMTFDLFRPDQSSTGSPRAYYLYYYSNPQSSTGQQWAISFEPIPDVAMLIEIRYLVRPPALSVGTDISAIPQEYHDVIADGATYLAYLWSNSPNASGMKQIYEAGVNNMIRDMGQSVDDFFVLQAVDDISRPSRAVPFPSEFGDV